MKKLSLRAWLSIVTVILIAIVLFFSRHELEHAWQLIGQATLWWLLLIIPLTAMSYMTEGEMAFSFLRQKKLIQGVSPFKLMRISFEMNFVNHILPSGGVSGISYGNWRMGKLGVTTGKATMAQLIRYAAGFGATIVLLIVSVLIVTLDEGLNRWMVLSSSTLVSLMIIATLLGMYLFKSQTRTLKFSGFVTKTINMIIRKVTFGKVSRLLKRAKVDEFFDEMHDDYRLIVREKKLLLRPFLWGLAFTAIGILQFFVAFMALGEVVNPAAILIGYSLASLAGFAVATPGGMGAYEAVFVAVLGIFGLKSGIGIAGILLARIVILLTTIGIGYVFYQLALIKHGKRASDVLGQ